MKRRVYQFILCAMCVASFSVPAYARELDTKAETLQTTEEIPISKSAHNMEYKKKKLNTKTVVKDLGEAGGQPSKGVSFQTGGHIYWQDGGSSQTYYIAVGNSVANVSVGIGDVAEGVTSYSLDVPAGRTRYKMGVTKTIEVREYEIFTRLAGSSNPWKHDCYTTEYKVTSIDFYLIRC